MNGWIKLHRKLLDWEWFNTEHMVRLFLYMLLSANHEPKQWKGLTIERGQLVTSLKSLSEKIGISIQQARTCIDRLKSTGEIASKSTNKFRIITVINWDSYQLIQEEINNQTNMQINRKLTNNQQTNPNKQEVKNICITDVIHNANSEELASKTPPCPYGKIKDMYEQKLPMCHVVVWTENRKRTLRAQWLSSKEKQDLQWWEEYFEFVAKSKFLTGKVNSNNGKPPFLASLDWLVKPENMAKVIQGKYS